MFIMTKPAEMIPGKSNDDIRPIIVNSDQITKITIRPCSPVSNVHEIYCTTNTDTIRLARYATGLDAATELTNLYKALANPGVTGYQMP
jgi:hypothetical protein